MIPEQCKIILTNNVRKTHGKPEKGTQQNIDREEKKFKTSSTRKKNGALC